MLKRRPPKFRVMIEGGAVFLLDSDTNILSRRGFFTTRWVRGDTADEVGAAACRMVLDEVAAIGARNPPDQPTRLKVIEVARLSLLESLRHPSEGRGFSFFPDAAA